MSAAFETPESSDLDSWDSDSAYSDWSSSSWDSAWEEMEGNEPLDLSQACGETTAVLRENGDWSIETGTLTTGNIADVTFDANLLVPTEGEVTRSLSTPLDTSVLSILNDAKRQEGETLRSISTPLDSTVIAILNSAKRQEALAKHRPTLATIQSKAAKPNGVSDAIRAAFQRVQQPKLTAKGISAKAVLTPEFTSEYSTLLAKEAAARMAAMREETDAASSNSRVGSANDESTCSTPPDGNDYCAPLYDHVDYESASGGKRSGQALQEKDDAYWERRRKNNLAAKRSRDARRTKEDSISLRAALLEEENIKLRIEVLQLREEVMLLKEAVKRKLNNESDEHPEDSGAKRIIKEEPYQE